MTGNDRDDKKELVRLAEALIQNVVTQSDDDIIAEAAEDYGDANATAERMRALVTAAANRAGRLKLEAARAALQGARLRTSAQVMEGSFEDKKRLLLQLIAKNKAVAQRLTLAARNADDLTESDLDSMLEDLRDLGLFDPADMPK
jgi:hypothetical protein